MRQHVGLEIGDVGLDVDDIGLDRGNIDPDVGDIGPICGNKEPFSIPSNFSLGDIAQIGYNLFSIIMKVAEE